LGGRRRIARMREPVLGGEGEKIAPGKPGKKSERERAAADSMAKLRRKKKRAFS